MKPETETKGGPAPETIRMRLEVEGWEENGFVVDIGVRRREEAKRRRGLWEVDAIGAPEDPGGFRVELVRSGEGLWPCP